MHRFYVRVFAAAGPNTTQSLPVSFDDAVAALEALPQMCVEPDGSFVWTSPADAAHRWQIEGNLVDGGQTLYYCELKGACPAEAIEQLLPCLSGGERLAFEVVERGVVLTEEEFRREITSPPDGPGPAPDRPG
jgi:hypothetical protein